MKHIKTFLKIKERSLLELYNFNRSFDSLQTHCTNKDGLCEEDNCKCHN